LTEGYDDTEVYEDAVAAKFGSIEAFLAIPPADLAAEDARFETVRPLISPKGSGTWNVGEEIQPGVWKAYDVGDCHWARLAGDGDIIDNHFGSALRLTVNVSSSDGQFEISSCTFYFDNP